jgi:hypothetical protein
VIVPVQTRRHHRLTAAARDSRYVAVVRLAEADVRQQPLGRGRHRGQDRRRRADQEADASIGGDHEHDHRAAADAGHVTQQGLNGLGLQIAGELHLAPA